MKNYLEEGDKVEGDWMIRNPEIIQEVLEQVEQLKGIYYAGVEHALRWVLCGTSVKPLPFGDK